MKWPFVRRSKYEHLTKCLDAKNDVIANQMGNIKEQFNEINRLNQELANELNSHRETKEKFIKAEALFDYWQKRCLNTEKELEETKDALKIAQEDTRQHKMSLDLADEKEENVRQYLLKVINYL